jgi:hypothetical protein
MRITPASTGPVLTANPRRRAQLTLTGFAAVLVMFVLVIVLLAQHLASAPSTVPFTGPGTGSGGDVGAGSWDWAGETALASRPMVYLPAAAADPQPLAPPSGQPRMRLPAPRSGSGWIAGGFPATAEGAVAQLAALTTQGLRGGDPEVYQRAYDQLSAPGAPSSAATKLASMLEQMRDIAHLAPTGPVPELGLSFTPTHAQVKGVLDNGRYVVVCVLGELTMTYQDRVLTSVGAGDCQAMRWLPDPASPTGGGWRISPGSPAAPSPDVWPGSQDAINAGFREIAR